MERAYFVAASCLILATQRTVYILAGKAFTPQRMEDVPGNALQLPAITDIADVLWPA